MNEIIVHKLPEHMVLRPWRVIVVGAGGTRSAVLPALARLHHAMIELGHPGGIECTVYDDDVVSQTNVGRQGFYPNDVGSFKASLIVNRLNMLMGTNWRAITQRLNGRTALFNVDLVIGCVDTRAARKAIVDAIGSGSTYYLDCGNDTDRGQVILGQMMPPGSRRKSRERLPHVADLFPDLVDPSLDAADETPSCRSAMTRTTRSTSARKTAWPRRMASSSSVIMLMNGSDCGMGIVIRSHDLARNRTASGARGKHVAIPRAFQLSYRGIVSRLSLFPAPQAHRPTLTGSASVPIFSADS